MGEGALIDVAQKGVELFKGMKRALAHAGNVAVIVRRQNNWDC